MIGSGTPVTETAADHDAMSTQRRSACAAVDDAYKNYFDDVDVSDAQCFHERSLQLEVI